MDTAGSQQLYKVTLYRCIFGAEVTVIEKEVPKISWAVEVAKLGMYKAGPGVVAARITKV